MPDGGFVGRDDPERRLREAFGSWGGPARLRLLSLSGPGGIGKTFLLDRALAGVDLAAERALLLRVSGASLPRTLAQLVARDLVLSAPEPPRGVKDPFRALGADLRLLGRLDDEARAEAEAGAKGDRALLDAINEVVKLGVGLQDAVPFVRRYVNLRQVSGESLLRAAELIAQSRAYQEPRRLLRGLLPEGVDPAGRRGRLRGRNLAATLAEDLTFDLAGLLAPRDRQPARRLILVLDDYEQMSETMGPFLIDELVPRLAEAPFSSLLLLVGRDRLLDAHLAFQDRLKPFLVGDIGLAELSEPEARAYAASAGVTDPAVVARIVDETRGYPYLLASEVDAELSGGRSALGLKGFYERITRWMTPEQRGWLLPLCFLEQINEDTIAAVLPGAPAAEVLAWFQGEASIRSPRSAHWQVLPILRSRFQEYLRNDSPARHAELTARAARAEGGAGLGHRVDAPAEAPPPGARPAETPADGKQ